MKLITFLLLFSISIINTSYAQVSYLSNNGSTSLDDSLNLIKDIIQNITISNGIFDKLSQDLQKYGKEIPDCITDIGRMFWSLKSFDNKWAYKMLDAQAKIPSGIMDANINWMGNVRECQDVAAPEQTAMDTKLHAFTGQYCTLTVDYFSKPTSAPIPLTLGLCLPSSCDLRKANFSQFHNDLLNVTESIPQIHDLLTKVTIGGSSCLGEEIPMDSGATVVIVIYSILITLTIVATLTDVILSSRTFARAQSLLLSKNPSSNYQTLTPTESTVNTAGPPDVAVVPTEEPAPRSPPTQTSTSSTPAVSLPLRILRCFSLTVHMPKILSMEKGEGDMGCLYGIRFLSMCWVILGHTCYFSVPIIKDPAQALKVLDNFFLEPLLQAPLSVDTFFLLSGMLLTYIFLKHSAKKPVNWIQFYVHRYLRLTPTYMLILAFWTTIFPHLLQSPLGLIRKDLSECSISWWWNLLYISNFRNSQCMGWSWYLANDMQFYIISPLFLIPLLKWPKIGLAILGALLLGSWVTIAIIADIFNIVPTLAGIGDITVFQIGALIDRESLTFKYFYDKPYCRIPPYLIGAALGYFLYRALHHRRPKMKAGWWLAGWAVAMALLAVAVFSNYHAPVVKAEDIPFLMFQKSAWGLGLAWIIYACLLGHGGWVNSFLSMPLWMPFSKLTYCAYLIHPMVVYGVLYSLTQTLNFSLPFFLIIFFGHLCVAYILALFGSCLLEAPVIALEKIFTTRH